MGVRPKQSRRAFTLIELVLAAVLGTFVAGAVVASLTQFLRARGTAESKYQAQSRADAAASRIANDLRNTIRDSNLLGAQVGITHGLGAAEGGDSLLLLAKGTRPVWGDVYSPEGEDYEVQFRVASSPEKSGTALWRRVDPGMDAYIDGGGIAAAVVPGVVSLTLSGYDGTTWYEEWRSDKHGMPHAVKVTVVARSDDGKYRATSRRVVAIDRVPIPPAEVASEEGGDDGGTAGGTTGTAGGGTPGTGGPR